MVTMSAFWIGETRQQMTVEHMRHSAISLDSFAFTCPIVTVRPLPGSAYCTAVAHSV
jgi:hypothetical protein